MPPAFHLTIYFRKKTHKNCYSLCLFFSPSIPSLPFDSDDYFTFLYTTYHLCFVRSLPHTILWYGVSILSPNGIVLFFCSYDEENNIQYKKKLKYFLCDIG